MGVGDEDEIHADEGFGRDRCGGESGDADGFRFDAHADAFGEDRIDRDGDIADLGDDRAVPEPEDGEVVMGELMENLWKVDRLVGDLRFGE